jgi:histidinol-phosphate aminotransferase
MKPYVPGRSLESVRRELGNVDLVKMNQNENPLGPSPRALEAIKTVLSDLSTYPDGLAPALRERVAALWDLPDDWILAGNGSDEIFRLLAETYLEPGDSVVVPAPSFGGYPLVAELMGAEVVRVNLFDNTMDLPSMARAAAKRRTPLAFLCRPNSPTGEVFSEEGLRAALPLFPSDTLVVLDEAYREFDVTQFDSQALLLDHPNLVVTRTFSKIYGLAGLRLGYGVMRPEVLAPLLRARDPFSVNLAAVAAGVAALGDHEHRERSRAMVLEGRALLYGVFERLRLDYVPTQSNFVLFHTQRAAVDVYEDLLGRGVLVRPCASFGLPNSLRVTIGTPEQNRLFAAALESVQLRSPGA